MRALLLAAIVLVPSIAIAQDWLDAAAERFGSASPHTIAASRRDHASPAFTEAHVLTSPGATFAIVAARHRAPRDRELVGSATLPYRGGHIVIRDLAFGPGLLEIRVVDRGEDVHLYALDRRGGLTRVLSYAAQGPGVRTDASWDAATATLVLTEELASPPGSGCIARPPRHITYHWDGASLIEIARDPVPPACP